MNKASSYTILLFFLTSVSLLLNSCGVSDTNNEDSIGEWKPSGLEGVRVFELKEASGYLYASAGKDGLYRNKLNSNSEWEHLGLSAPEANFGIITSLYDSADDIMYAGALGSDYSETGVFRSDNAGESWEAYDNGIAELTGTDNSSIVANLEMSPFEPGMIVAGTTIGLFMRSSELTEWQYSQGSITGAWLGIQALTFNPSKPNQIWLGSADDRTTAQLKRSDDHGESWEQVDIGSVTEFTDVVQHVEIHPENENIYLCLESKFAISIDDGETWSVVENFENEAGEEISVGCSSIKINPANPDEMYLSGLTMNYSTDAGETWQTIPEPDRFTILDFHVDWENRIVYASLLNPDFGVYRFNY
ncbi:hypothetical protein BH23BAC3_BH23BAC3_26500 [soil metagenome]